MLCPNCNSLANAQDMHQNRSEAETHQSTREDLPNRPDDMDGLRAGVRREGVCCGQEWMMAMKDEAGCVDFREVGRILCLSVMVHCNQHSDGRAGAAGARRRWRKEDAAAGRAERRWLWRNSGAEDGIMVDRLLRKKLLEGERGRS